MNIFSSLVIYAKWTVKSRRDFTSEEINAVETAVVVPSEYGCSVMFNMIGGGACYIPLSNDSTCGEGDLVDLNKASLITLEKPGEEDIYRVEYFK